MKINVNRFMSYVGKGAVNECWPWLGGHIPSGYGAFSVNGKSRGAHRVSYIVHGKGDPAGKVVRHTCDNPNCVNPAHLILGTQADNMRDRLTRGKYARGEGAHNVRLTTDMVIEARRRRLNGASVYSLAKEYGVNKGTLHNAIYGKTWAHVPGALTLDKGASNV